MFQCIIQQRNGWIHAPNPEMRDVFPGNKNRFHNLTLNKLYKNITKYWYDD